MQKMSEKQKWFIIAGGVAVIIGIILIICSPTMGVSLANGQVPIDGLDANQYNAFMNGYIKGIRTIGSIIAILGGLEAICAYYFFKNTEGRKEDGK